MNKQRLILFALLCFAWFGSHAQTTYNIGDVYTFLDGSQGVVFSVNRDHTAGCVVATAELYNPTPAIECENTCSWSAGFDHVDGLINSYNRCEVMKTDGYANTVCVLREAERVQPNPSYSNTAYPLFGKLCGFTPANTFFSTGWFIPSLGQLRQIYAALSVISDESVFGVPLDTTYYWTSNELASENWGQKQNVYRQAWHTNFGTGETSTAPKTWCNLRIIYEGTTPYFYHIRGRAVRNFPEDQFYTLTVNGVSGKGRGIGSQRLRAGTVTKISAVPEAGYKFSKWNDGNTSNPRSVTVNADATYTASFTAAGNCTLTVKTCDANWGTVSGGGSGASGRTATITASPAANYQFVRWNDGNTDNPRTVTVTKNITYTAAFAPVGSHVFVGDIMCSDGVTIRPEEYVSYKSSHSGVKAKGIVFYVDDRDGTFQHGYVQHLKMWIWPWGAYNLDVSCEPDYFGLEEAILDMNGRENTDQIIEFFGDVTTGAKLCRNEGEEWFMPSIGQVNLLHVRLPEMQATLNTIAASDGAAAVEFWPQNNDFRYWSSTEGNPGAGWYIFSSGRLYGCHKSSDGFFIRPISAF